MTPPETGAAAPDGDAARALRALFEPISIAVIGATERPQYGGRFVANLQAGGFRGRLYPVNPNRETVFGLRCYPSIAAVPEPVDLAAIIIPAPKVPEALAQCAAAGVRAAVVISAGFAETGPDGAALQEQLARVARRGGLRVLGPNCLGLANVAAGIWATASTPISAAALPRTGPIGLVSQSGASAFGPLLTAFRDREIGLRMIVSTGNEADLDLAEVVQYLLADPEIRVVAAFLEGVRRPEAFLECLDQALLAGKPLVLVKIGRSGVGQRAAATPTAALTGSDAVHEALFRQRGVVRVDDDDALAEVTALLARAPLPRGDRVGVISHSGGITGLLGDKIGEQGLHVPPLAEGTVQRLAAILAGRGAATNPADITTHFQRETFREMLELISADENVDLVAVATAGSREVVQRVIDAAAASGKPTVYVWTGSLDDRDGLPHLRASGLPVFHLPGRAARALRQLVDYRAVRQRVGAGRLPWRQAAAELPAAARARLEQLAGRQTVLNELEAFPLLEAAGLPIASGQLATNETEALAAADALGYPVVAKAVSPQLLHKTEAGAVRLGLRDAEELRAAYHEVLASVRRHRPDAEVAGVLIQRLVRGVEVIAGVSRDAQFGPVLLLGLGGVQAEALAAISLRLCPIDAADAQAMIAEAPGLERLLGGFRGQPAADRAALIDLLVRLSQLAHAARGQVASIDLNPVLVLPDGQGVQIVDAVIALSGAR